VITAVAINSPPSKKTKNVLNIASNIAALNMSIRHFRQASPSAWHDDDCLHDAGQHSNPSAETQALMEAMREQAALGTDTTPPSVSTLPTPAYNR
jgi:hypothetical protein